MLIYYQRCKTRNVPCIETEERQQQELRKSHYESTQPDEECLAPTPDLPATTAIGPSTANGNASPTQPFAIDESLLSLPNATIHEDTSHEAFDPAFPEFFEHIMMPFATGGFGTSEIIAKLPDVSNYTQDFSFDATDLDLSFLDTPAFRSPKPLDETNTDPLDAHATKTPNSEAGPRSEALKRSPWSWSSWAPPRGVGAFSELAELDVRQDRVDAADQLTSPGARQVFHCSLSQNNRDQMIRIVTKCTANKLFVISSSRHADPAPSTACVF